MKIAVVWDWVLASWAKPLAHDGLMAAMDLIGMDNQVDWYLDGEYPEDKYDWILPWGVGSIKFNKTIEKYSGRKALLCAGHPQDTDNFNKFEAIFAESPSVYEQIRAKGYRTILAFGTDTEYFKPRKRKKIIDAFYPATYSQWKRQDLFTEALGSRGLTCGTIQPDGVDLYERCLANNTYALAGLMPSRLVAEMYNLARCCVITSWHGSERTLLEAMSSNCPVVITRDNELTCSLANDEVIRVDPTPEGIWNGVQEALEKRVNTREYIFENYSHNIYAERIKKVLYDA